MCTNNLAKSKDFLYTITMYSRWIIPLFFVLVLGSHSFASEPAGSRIQGMGGAGVAVPFDVSTVYWNPAGIYFQNRLGTDFTFSFDELEWPQDWGFSYLNYSRSSKTGAGLGIYRVKETHAPEGGDAVTVLLSTVYRTPIGLPVGLSFKYINERWADEGRKSHWSGDLGLLLPYGSWLLGLCIQSITDPNSHLVPYRILAGISWRMGDMVVAAAQLSGRSWEDFEDIDKAELRAGLDVSFSRAFSLQGGWVRTPDAEYWTGGLGLQHQRRTRLSVAYHWYREDEPSDRLYVSYSYLLQ